MEAHREEEPAMQRDQQQPLSRWFNAVAIALALVAARFMYEPIARWVPRHSSGPWSGIVSAASLNQLDPRRNYLAFLASLGATFLILSAVLAGGRLIPESWRQPRLPSLPRPVVRGMAAVLHRLAFLLSPWLLVPLSVMLVATWAINQEYVSLGTRIAHGFHEGEYIGFAPTLLRGGGLFTSAFYIHGFAINALPELLARTMGFTDNTIAATRAVRMVESILAWPAMAWLIWEITRASGARRRFLPVFLGALLIVFALSDVTYYMTLRRTVSFLQLATLLLAMRGVMTRESDGVASWLTPGLIGLSLPLALLYDYSEAVCFAAIAAFASLLVLLTRRKAIRRWLGGMGTGAALGTLLLLVSLGPTQFAALFQQVIYWASYGRLIWFTPLNPFTASESPRFFALVAVPSLTLAYLFFDRQKGESLREWIAREWLLLVLLVATLLGDRVALDRALEEHLGWSGVSTTLLMVALGLAAWRQVGDRPFAALLAMGGVFLSAGQANAHKLNPVLAVEKIQLASHRFWTSDEYVVPRRMRLAMEEIASDVAKSRTFYTLSSEGVWYTLFKKPSASRFHQVVYARTPEAQGLVIQDLEHNRPDIILHGSSVRVDGYSPEVTDYLVERYILDRYRPYRAVGSTDFWKRAAHPLTETMAGAPGVDGRIANVKDTDEGTTWFTGTMTPPAGVRPGDPVRIYMTADGTLFGYRELADSDVTWQHGTLQWSVELGTSFLPASSRHYQAWLYDEKGDRLMPLTSR